MTALQCQTCKSVWLPAQAGDSMDARGLPGCLRCDGELQRMTVEHTRAHIERLTKN